MYKSKFVVVALAAATVLSGCAGDPYSPTPRQDSGVLTGALAGGALGALLGGRGAGSRVAGAVIGAAAGGLLGGAIGASLDERDRQIAYAAEMQALESGQPGAAVGWRGEQSGYYGNVVPGPYYQSNGRRCRQYTHTVYINGRPEVARGTACRNPDGTWIAVT
jgi:surface antigen